MKIVFYSLILNNHQANVADQLWELTGHQYCFVELANLQAEHRKGDSHDYSDRPYLLRAWASEEEYNKAMDLALTAECCVFSGELALPFQKARMKAGLFSFDMSERWLKRGIKNLFSPAIFKMFWAYHVGKWAKKPIYKLCCNAFAAADQNRVGTYKEKCYKWGYFTRVEEYEAEQICHETDHVTTTIMWCARYLKLKHPELPVLMAQRLKAKGYQFRLDMYGSGEYENRTKSLVEKLNVADVVTFVGSKPNEELLQDMRKHDIFIFTSDRNEGWGAVANESMANGCALVASDVIGSSPYLIKDGENGLMFRSPKTASGFDSPDKTALDALCEKVEWLLDNPSKMSAIRMNAIRQMRDLWNPLVAAVRLLELIARLKSGKDTIFHDGPCSKA